MRSVNNGESNGRQPRPWLTVLFVIATVIVGFVVPSRWLARNPLLLELVGALASTTAFVLYTSIYGGVRAVGQHRSLLTVLMLASPWLFAAVNLWGKLAPSVFTRPAALTALVTALAIGVSEELLFRGILFRAFQGKKITLYVLVTSITFGLLHYQQGFQGVMVTAIVGGSYSLARVAGAPLVALILCHTATDFPGLFPHTPHSKYSLVAFISLVLVLVLAIIFLCKGRSSDWLRTARERP